MSHDHPCRFHLARLRLARSKMAQQSLSTAGAPGLRLSGRPRPGHVKGWRSLRTLICFCGFLLGALNYPISDANAASETFAYESALSRLRENS